MPDSHHDSPSPIREELKQRLRLRRYLQASAFSLLYLAVLAIFSSQGKVDHETLLQACALVGGLILAFFVLFRLGINLRFRDPSLTAMQVLASVFTMLFVFYKAPDTRLVFSAFFFVALMFGMLRANSAQLIVLGFVSLAAFTVVACARYMAHGDAEVLRLDMLQLVVTAVAFPWFVFIGGRVKVLREAGRRKDDFLATLSHELRNPLSPIRAGIHILRLPDGPSQAATVLPMMERQLQHLTRLLDDLLDASRIARGKFALQVEPIDLAQAVQAAVEANRSLIAQMRHELTVALPAEPVILDADPVRLAQVFSNLLNNAAKYTPPGGRITLTVPATRTWWR
jgi:signal transduction histidine kinase